MRHGDVERVHLAFQLSLLVCTDLQENLLPFTSTSIVQHHEQHAVSPGSSHTWICSRKQIE